MTSRLFAIVLVALGAGPGFAAAVAPQPGVFPPAGIDLVTHELTIDVLQVLDDGTEGALLETLKFTGNMLLERTDPVVNEQGFRQINFVVQSWEAHAFSNALDTVITYRLSEGDQESSTIVAQQKDRDFPATFTFNVIFDAIAYGNIFFPRHHGRPWWHDFFEVPPSGNRRTSPTILGFETARIEMDHPGLGRILFKPRNCNDSGGQTIGSKRVVAAVAAN